MDLKEIIIGNITGNFKIEAYQRGYRWSDDEIKHLLEDIDESNQKYCLQPVVIKNVDGAYELIDGQQRMTTLYLIMKYLSLFLDIKYSIEYTTRKSENGRVGSKELLESIDTIDLSSRSANIDELFIKKAYLYIKNWFKGEKGRMLDFATKLNNNITVIWYEVDADENSVDIFTRLNIGKINLTNAELVKALFLSRGKKDNSGNYSGNPYGIEEKRQHEIALEWDAMEKGLHDDTFWAFITNEKAERYPIRMELFFDIMEKKPNKEDNFYTFNRFYERFKNTDDKYKTWETIVRYYQQLREWFRDFDLYHQIGYLVAMGESIKELLDLAMDEKKKIRKSQFRNEIISRIRDSVLFVKGEGDQQEVLDYAELNYEQHKPFIQTLLLLFNVETIRQKKDKGMRFPFDSYKKQGVWSLEHIHAQNSESLKSNQEWRSWLVLHKKSLTELKKTLISNTTEIRGMELSQEIEMTCSEIDGVIAHIDDKNYKGSIREEFARVSKLVVDILSDGDDKSMIHTISNMALLTVGENAALSNSTFDVKRMTIIEMDKKGDYIPVCTKNVFMKYYSSSDTKLHFWAEEDRKCYIKAMNDVLYHHMDENGNEIKLINTTIHYGNR